MLVIGISGVGVTVAVANATIADGADISALVTDAASLTSTGTVRVMAEMKGTNLRNEAIAEGHQRRGIPLRQRRGVRSDGLQRRGVARTPRRQRHGSSSVTVSATATTS